MPLALRDDVFFCLTDRSAIFLDLAANRYFGLTGSADLAFRSIVNGDDLDSGLERALQPLFLNGLATTYPSATVLSQVMLPVPTQSLMLDVHAATLSGVAHALCARAQITIEMRLVGLKRMVHRRRTRKATKPPGLNTGQVLANTAAAHRRLDQMLGSADRCLARSFALIDHLARRGHFPNLVIGVRTGGFSAHCWVQLETVVLNDDTDRVRQFTPIFVL